MLARNVAASAVVGCTAVLIAAGYTNAHSGGATFADYPETRIDYYDVPGKTAKQLRQSLNELGPYNEKHGRRFDAYASYNFTWRYAPAGSKRCPAQIKLETSVVFPRLRSRHSVPASVKKRWDEYSAALEAHEVGHVALAYKAMPKLKRALENGPCRGANDRAQKVIDELRRQNADYDKRTNHGASTGVRFP